VYLLGGAVNRLIRADEFELDNRDLMTTWIELKNGDVIEVDPWALVLNVIRNYTDDGEVIRTAEMDLSDLISRLRRDR
jgi:hypothetical protein